MSTHDLTVVGAGSMFAAAIQRVFAASCPRRIVETGTYRGEGTTTAIASAIRAAEIEDTKFHSIEVNSKHLERARQNLARSGLDRFVTLHHGLSVPRDVLPSLPQIEDALVHHVQADQLVVDHEEADRARLYFAETDFPSLPDDLLGNLLAQWEGRPDFVLLDSGGHMGFLEFSYVIELLKGPCFIALDDVHHVKHHRSFERIRRDERFSIVATSEEKFGFCIARFVP